MHTKLEKYLSAVILGVMLGFIFVSCSKAMADCGPTIKVDTDIKDYLDEDRGHVSAGISVSIPWSDIDCKKEEANIAKTREQEREVKIRNLANISRICKANEDNPKFAQLCHVELPELLKEVVK